MEKTKNIIKLPWIRILKVSNKSMLTTFAHEIIWKLEYSEKALLECDASFLNMEKLKYYFYKKSHVNRLMMSNFNKNITPDFLYSEIAMLKEKP